MVLLHRRVRHKDSPYIPSTDDDGYIDADLNIVSKKDSVYDDIIETQMDATVVGS